MLKHLVPTLEANRTELERERRAASVPTPESPRASKPKIVREPSPKKHLLNIEEASERLSISKATLYKYASERRIPFYKFIFSVLDNRGMLRCHAYHFCDKAGSI